MGHPELPYEVQAKWPDSHRWEPIAAFNSQSIALNYAVRCSKGLAEFAAPAPNKIKYRVEKREIIPATFQAEVIWTEN